MGLVEKLTDLDEAIWEQYEKVTQYCNKEFGWDKYDLMKASSGLTSASFFGANFYMSLAGWQWDNPRLASVGTFGAAVGIGLYYLNRSEINETEKKEVASLHNGVIKKPIFGPKRPSLFTYNSIFYSYFLYRFATKQGFPDSLGLNTSLSSDENILGALVSTSLLFLTFFGTCKLYFSDQIPTPPQKKKSVLKTLYEKTIGKLQVAPQPQLEPKYESIDDVVA